MQVRQCVDVRETLWNFRGAIDRVLGIVAVFGVLDKIADISRTGLFFRCFADQLESEHRRNMASKKRHWAASEEAQREKARDALNQELQETRARHSREIGKLESRLFDTKDRLEKAITETEEANEAANTEKATLESALAELKHEIVEEKNVLREAREAAQKVQGAGASRPDEDIRRELTRLISDLEDERKHVAHLEGQLKEANNGEAEMRPQDEESAASKIAQLQAKLEHKTRENESLRKEAARVIASEGDIRRSDGVGASSGDQRVAAAPLEHIEVNNLRKALEESKMKLSELQREKDLSVQVRQTRRSHDNYSRQIRCRSQRMPGFAARQTTPPHNDATDTYRTRVLPPRNRMLRMRRLHWLIFRRKQPTLNWTTDAWWSR